MLSDTRIIWCESQPCEERAADGATVNLRAFTHGLEVAGAARFLITDHLGSVTEITDTAAAVLTRYTYDPWGRRTLVSGVDAARDGYTGHLWQTNGGLWLTQFRAYDPELGRWLSPDPSGYDDGPNLYQYVGNAPVQAVDPTGLQLIVTGPPPSHPPPLNCSATPWKWVRYGLESKRIKRKWKLISTVTPEIANSPRWGIPGAGLGIPNGVASPFAFCICRWALVGVIEVRRAYNLWVRTVTCCNQTHTEHDKTYRDHELPQDYLTGRYGLIRTTTGFFSQGFNSCTCPEPN